MTAALIGIIPLTALAGLLGLERLEARLFATEPDHGPALQDPQAVS